MGETIKRHEPGWSVRPIKGSLRRRFWWHVWLPRWHDGRGKYVTIGLGLFAIYRGY